MKKIIKLLITILMIMPVFVYASVYANYTNAHDKAKVYVTKSNFRNTYKKYLLNDSNMSHFISGDEYEATKNSKGYSYLFDGSEYWTNTPIGSGHYAVGYNGQLKKANDTNDKYNVKDVEYVLSGANSNVIGRGTYSNPWSFGAVYEVKIKTDTRYGYIYDQIDGTQLATTSDFIPKGTEAKFTMYSKSTYMYLNNDCGASYNNGTLIIARVTRPITCNVFFGVGQFEITLKGGANPGIIYAKHGDNYYKDNKYKNTINKITPPTKAGYTFDGYYLTSSNGSKIKIINGDGTINRNTVNSITSDVSLDPSFVVNAPSSVTISATGSSGEKVYNKDNVTLTCATSTTYDSDTTIKYQFGYSSSNSFTDGSITWIGSGFTTSNTYTVSKTDFIGTSYFGCKAKATNAVNETEEVKSTSTVMISYAHPRVDFDANGGTISGTSTLYAGYGSNKVYTGRNNLTSGTIPTATKTGYGFDGWYTEKTGGSAVIDSSKALVASISNWTNSSKQWILTNLSSNTGTHTLYAHFKANQLTFSNSTLNEGNYGTAYTSNAFGGAVNGTGSYTYTLKSGYPTGAVINSANRTISFTNTTPAGTYNVVVHAKDNTSGSEKDATMTIKINKVAATLTCGNKTYSGSAQTGCTCNGGTIAGTYSATNAGSYTAKCTGDANHTSPADKTWTINKKTAAITAKAQTINYGGSIATGTGQITASDLISGHSVTAITLTPSTTNATTSGTITPKSATIKNSGGTDVTNNYSITYKTGTLTINKVAATLTCSNKTYTGGAQTACTCSGGTIGGSPSATNAGTYTASCTPDSNHTAPANKTWTMNKKTATITAKAQTINYGGSIATGTGQITASDLISGHSVTAITLTPSTTNATTSGTITPKSATIKNSGGTDVTNNYSITYKTGTLTINKVAATITCNNKTYNGSAQTACTCSGGTIGGSPSATNAGSYTASCTPDSNHTAPADKSWTMNKKAITITAKNQSISYGGSISTGTDQVTVATLVSGHTLSSVTLTASTTNETTSGTITPSAATIKNSSGTAVTSNYSITYTKGTLTINKVAATITCSNKTYTGSAQTGCSCSGGTIAGTYSATNAGTYTASCTPDSNHTAPANKDWTMNKKALTITAKSQTINYGSSIATGTGQVTVSGLISGHTLSSITLTASTTAVTTSGTITPSAAVVKNSGGTAVTSNYSITYTKGTLTIKRSAPQMRLTAYRYDSSKANNCGTLVKSAQTFSSDGTFTVSDSWLTYGITVKVEILDTGGGSVTANSKWNPGGYWSDTGDNYSGGSGSGTYTMPATAYTTISAKGYRKEQWTIKDAANQTRTVTIVVKLSYPNDTSSHTHEYGTGPGNASAAYNNYVWKTASISCGGTCNWNCTLGHNHTTYSSESIRYLKCIYCGYETTYWWCPWL